MSIEILVVFNLSVVMSLLEGAYCLLSSVLQWERRNYCAMNSCGSS